MLSQRLTEKADRKLTSINLKHTVSFPSAQQAKRKKKRRDSFNYNWQANGELLLQIEIGDFLNIYIASEDFLHSVFPPVFSIIFVYYFICLNSQ